MKLITTILCGPDISQLPRAITSIVPHVDEVLLIDTVPDSASSRIDLVSLLPTDLPPPQSISRFFWPWQGRFDAARNESLALATEAGGDWAITTDADEWWTGAEELRELCEKAEPGCQALYCESANGYWQARAIRLPCSARWFGRTHEGLALEHIKKVKGPVFHEDRKTPEQLKAKAERDLVLIHEEIAEHPEEARWRYYRAETFRLLGRLGEALDDYLAVRAASRFPEEQALSCYRAAQIAFFDAAQTGDLGQLRFAIDICAHGLASFAGMAELPWLASCACLEMAKSLQRQGLGGVTSFVDQAMQWAELAQVHGGLNVPSTRILPVDPRAVGEGPRQVVEEIKARVAAQVPPQEP